MGIRQRWALSPDLYNLVLKAVITLVLRYEMRGVTLCERNMSYLRSAYGDSLAALARDDLQRLINGVEWDSRKLRLHINVEKTR